MAIKDFWTNRANDDGRDSYAASHFQKLYIEEKEKREDLEKELEERKVFAFAGDVPTSGEILRMIVVSVANKNSHAVGLLAEVYAIAHRREKEET